VSTATNTVVQGTGEISAGLRIDGLMARDLTCAPTAKHAYILRPLPTRADRLQRFATTQRAAMLRYTTPSAAICKCALVMFLIGFAPSLQRLPLCFPGAAS
jgi:hypothetical protein